MEKLHLCRSSKPIVEQERANNLQESEFTYEGVHYIGVNDASYTCEDCALNKSSRICMNAPYCLSVNRKDGRNLIFVEK